MPQIPVSLIFNKEE